MCSRQMPICRQYADAPVRACARRADQHAPRGDTSDSGSEKLVMTLRRAYEACWAAQALHVQRAPCRGPQRRATPPWAS